MTLFLFKNIPWITTKRLMSIHNVKRPVILGIETSCDDTAVAIVSADKKILASERYVDRKIQKEFGGIMPHISALQHRQHLERLINKCFDSANCRTTDLDAVAVAIEPGLVICLKVGMETAISQARLGRIPLIPVHHMRAHALSARLVYDDIEYPFLTLLISGGHSIIAVVYGPTDFDIIGEGLTTSPGECLDKIAREVGIKTEDRHYGAEIEKLAQKVENNEDYLKFKVKAPKSIGADFNFESIKSSFIELIRNNIKLPLTHNDLNKFCASLQFQIASHLCKKLNVVFQYPEIELLFEGIPKHLVVSGGVASNQFILQNLKKISNHYGFNLIVPPQNLCTDNGEMIAWTGIEMMNKNCSEIIPYNKLPSSIYCNARSDIGTSKLKGKIINDKFKPKRKMKVETLLSDRLSFIGKPIK